jgi:diguanylate cyclase (GGDEF)-like protein
MNVVVVDDRELNLRYLRNIVSEISGTVVYPFSSSADALTWSTDRDVDCFVIDYAMPAPDGIELVQLLRAMDRFATVPIVIVTGAHDREIRYRAFDAGATDFVTKPFDRREMIARLTTLLDLRAAQQRLAMQIGWLEASLLDSEERSREHAERLEALWRLANDPEPDEELILTMLRQAAASIRRDQPFIGLLGRVEDNEVVTEAIAGDLPPALRSRLCAGARLNLDDTLVIESIRRGRTQSWDDMQGAPGIPRTAHGYDWRAVITTHFRVGSDTHALTFASTEPAKKPFRVQDHTYVEVLAQVFATHLQQQWQSAQIRRQLERDSLTALWNRSRFRSLGRAALQPEQPAAVLVVDLLDFHQINEAHGHLTGDALLVEAAAALAAEAAGAEVVARVGGDSFAVCFPQFATYDDLMDRVAAFGAVLEAPLSIGDRTGTERIRTSAVLGVAIGPEDGKSIDELLLRAEARAHRGGATGHR